MDCLFDFICVRGGTKVPDSGMYINDLPGISLNSISGIANTEQVNFQGAWDAVQRRACAVLETAFTNAMSRKYRIKKLTESYDLSKTIDSGSTIAASPGEFRGIYIDSFFWKSAFHYIPITSVNIYFPAIVTTTLKVYEVQDDTLTELDSFEITTTAGWNKVLINKKYGDSRRIFIAYDATEVESVALNLNSAELSGWIMNSLGYMWSHLYINGARYADGAFLGKDLNTHGMTAAISIQCGYDALICAYKDNIKLAWWYLLGAELMKERVYTDRINRYTTIDLGRARELTQMFQQEYMNELATFIDSIDLQHDWCVECDAQIRKVTVLP